MNLGVLAHSPRFLTRDEVLSLHETAIDEHGGSHGLRDPGLLESAIAMPAQAFAGQFAHLFPFEMAAAYAFHIAKNHPFVDGNKRTAFACANVFLRLNGWATICEPSQATEFTLQVATGTLDKQGAAIWLADMSRPLPSLEVRDFFAQLDYQKLSTVFGAIANGPPNERAATIQEASLAVPAIQAANMTAVALESQGKADLANILRQHGMLLTVLYRIAEDMGYEW
jgi:death-on-curing protein